MYTSTLSVFLLATQALSVFAAPATHGAGIYRRQEAAVNATAQEARIKDLATKFEQLRAAVDVTEGKTTTPEETTANIDSLANALTIGEAGKSAGTAASADQLKAGEELLAVKNSIIAVGTEAAASDKQRLDEIAAGAGNGTAAVDPAASADRVNKLALSFEGVRAAINTAQGKENATEADLTERIDTLSKKIVLGEEGKSAGDAATPEQLAVGQELLAVKNSLIAVGQAGAETNDERLAEIAAGANSTAAVGAAATGKEKLIADLEAALAEAKAL